MDWNVLYTSDLHTAINTSAAFHGTTTLEKGEGTQINEFQTDVKEEHLRPRET